MASLKKFVALLVSACMVTVSCLSVEHQTKRSLTRWCGPSLAQALHLVCNGVYQKMFKKSSYFDLEAGGAGTGEDVLENVPLLDEVSLLSLLMQQPPLVDLELVRSGMRVRRGVSDECCHKGCTLAVLSSYCAE